MKFMQTKDVIRWAADFHHGLGQQYGSLARAARDERARMLLDYLAQHEHELHAGLERYLQTAPPAVLDTWLKLSQELPQADALEAMRSCLCCASVDDAERAAAQLHEGLRALYQALSESTETAAQRELFESLAAEEEAENRRMVRDASELGTV